MKILSGILVIGLGVLGAYVFSTQVTLSRTLADILIMVTLIGSLVIGNSLIVFGQKKKGKDS
jgi:nitrate reductase gamma subunit